MRSKGTKRKSYKLENNIYIDLYNDKVFVLTLQSLKSEITLQDDINILHPEIYAHIVARFPDILKVDVHEMYALLFNLDTFLIVELLFGGFKTPQVIAVEDSIHNDQLEEFLSSQGYIYPEVKTEEDPYGGAKLVILLEEDQLEDEVIADAEEHNTED